MKDSKRESRERKKKEHLGVGEGQNITSCLSYARYRFNHLYMCMCDMKAERGILVERKTSMEGGMGGELDDKCGQ